MRQPEDYARLARRWGLAAVATYATFVGILAFALRVPPLNSWGILVASVACAAATEGFLIRWVQRDVAEGRFRTRGRQAASTAARFVPGLVMFGLAFATIPLGASPLAGLLLVSGNVYILLALVAEVAGFGWARHTGLGPPRLPPEPAVNFTVFVNVYAAIAGVIVASALSATLPLVIACTALLGFMGAFAFLVVLVGNKSEASPRPLWQAWLVRRPITMLETLLLLGCVVVDVGLLLLLLLFALPASLHPPPTFLP